MKPFDYISGNTLENAEKILGKSGERVCAMAGGTDLMGILKDRVHPVYPDAVVDLKTIEGLSNIEVMDHEVAIGALVRLRDLAENSLIQGKFGLLAQAARSVASPQIRNMGTVAGNICQEPRCWYYRNPDNTFHCARKQGKACNALTGDNRFHSIFGSMRMGRTPCTEACPVHTNIPSYIELIRKDKLDEAAGLILEVNPMPSVTGRVCPHFCEQDCNRQGFEEAVSIRDIERVIGDHILAHHERFMVRPQKESGQRIAVIGSGPSGLATAYFLRRSGHRVVVFDRMEKAGGMLRYGIPTFRLPDDILDRFLLILQGMGIEFQLGTEIKGDEAVSELLGNYPALYAAGGTWKSTVIPLEGRQHTISGLDFLASVNNGERTSLGKKVLVIGGGNVAVDVAVTAKRLGAEDVVITCLEKRHEMPALDWEIEHALEEGITLMNGWGPSRVLLFDEKVSGLELVVCTSVFDDQGCFNPELDRNSVQTVDADSIVLAVGQGPDDSLSIHGLDKNNGYIQADPETQATKIQGFFAGGDMVSGPATVVEAIASGRRAALSINQFMGSPSFDHTPAQESLNHFPESALEHSNRQKPEYRATVDRDVEGEDQSNLNRDQLIEEANRCFNCGCVAVCPSDLAPALVALDAKIVTGKRTIPAERFFTVVPFSSTVLEPGEIVAGITIPDKKNLKTCYLKFRIRNAIDFPIAGVAVALELKTNIVTAARIVLGAAAPVPLRAREAESILVGREIDEKAAEEAAQAALGGSVRLGKNGYKLKVFRALVKRTILSVANNT